MRFRAYDDKETAHNGQYLLWPSSRLFGRSTTMKMQHQVDNGSDRIRGILSVGPVIDIVNTLRDYAAPFRVSCSSVLPWPRKLRLAKNKFPLSLIWINRGNVPPRTHPGHAGSFPPGTHDTKKASSPVEHPAPTPSCFDKNLHARIIRSSSVFGRFKISAKAFMPSLSFQGTSNALSRVCQI